MYKRQEELVNEKCALLGLKLLMYQIKFIGLHPNFKAEFSGKDGKIDREKLRLALQQFAEQEMSGKTLV